jgi:choline dehydrogenase-like flavoprotein
MAFQALGIKATCQARHRVGDNARRYDASILPTITSGITNSPTIMVAERAADLNLREF